MGFTNLAVVLRQKFLRRKYNPTLLRLRHEKQLLPPRHLLDEDFIKSLTVISSNHLTPELKLRLITPECEAWHCDSRKLKLKNDPFWAIYWPGGQALSRYILDNQNLFRNKNVLDIGSGSGACAIAAAKCEASVVVANDIDELSLKAIKINAELNEVKIHLEKGNIIGSDVDLLKVRENDIVLKPKWDVVLVGDMFYDSEFSNKLFTWLCDLNNAGKAIFIGDPGRYSMKDILQTGKLIKLADYAVMDYEHFGFSSFNVWKISSSS